ncbi:hypothetical protein ACUL41_04020 [Virgibacillus natechei]|uniref:hypothetical protein n=1 Tax=Virgibacillus sp. CBA3643 TaxID=2942278 RepID=UPI0035A32F66
MNLGEKRKYTANRYFSTEQNEKAKPFNGFHIPSNRRIAKPFSSFYPYMPSILKKNR